MFVSAARCLKFHSLYDDSCTLTYNPLHPNGINSLSLSKDNGFLTFVSENQQPEIISLRDPENIKNIHNITSISGASAVAFERTTKRIIGIGTNTGQAALYDTKSKSIYTLFESAPSAINLLEFNVGDKQMAVSCMNGSVLLYDTDKTKVRETYGLTNSTSAASMRFHPLEKNILTIGTEDGIIIHLDVDTGHDVFAGRVHTGPVTGVAAVKNSNFLVSVGYDHKFCIHDTKIAKSVFRSNLQHTLTAVDASCDGRVIAVGTLFGNLYVFDIRNLLVPLIVDQPHNSRINTILFENNIKDDFIEAIPKSQTEANHLNREIIPEGNCFIRNTDESKIKSDYLPKPKANSVLNNTPPATKSLSGSVKHAISDGAEEIQNNLMQQLKGLQNFITDEFSKIEADFRSKWDFQNLSI